MEEDTHGFTADGGRLQDLREGVTHQRHLAGQSDVVTHQHPSAPVGRVRELLGALHRLDGFGQRLQHKAQRQSPWSVPSTLAGGGRGSRRAVSNGEDKS